MTLAVQGQQADIGQCAIPSDTVGRQEESAQSTAGDTVPA